MFGRNAPEGKTVLLLDIESGSVGGALVRLAPEERPKLFGETRCWLPVAHRVSGANLAVEAERAVHEVLQKLSDLASRLRHAEAQGVQPIGKVASTTVFFAPPWGRPDLQAGAPQFMPDLQAKVRTAAEARFSRLPMQFYTTAGLATFANNTLFEPEPALIYMPGGEVSDMLHHDGAGIRAHATLPVGTHALIRTLRTHGGLSELEARSAARLPFNTPHLRESFDAAAAYLGEQFSSAAGELLQDGVQKVRIMGDDASAHWLAQALTHYEPLSELFPRGGEVRALRTGQLAPYIAAHQEVPDTRLMLGALFVDSQSR